MYSVIVIFQYCLNPGPARGLEIKLEMTDTRHQRHSGDVPRLVPTGSVDKVLLTGGKNLTLFQSVGLVMIGFGVALGIGVPILVNESYLVSRLARFGYHGSLWDRLVATAFLLSGAVMIFNGLLGIARRIRNKSRD